MANPSRKDAEKKAKKQRKNKRKNNNGRTSKKPEVVETEQPSPAEVKTGQEQNGRNARKSRTNDSNPKARRSNRSDNYSHATNSNGLLSPGSIGVNYKVFDAWRGDEIA